SIMDAELSLLESQFVPAAEAMPQERYAFVPTTGDYKGVRTFALQVKHVATSNLACLSAMLGRPVPPGIDLTGPANGPEELRTKAEILKYLKDSFALGHQAVAPLSAANATVPLLTPPMRAMNTPLALAAWSCAHAWAHYGEMGGAL